MSRHRLSGAAMRVMRFPRIVLRLVQQVT